MSRQKFHHLLPFALLFTLAPEAHARKVTDLTAGAPKYLGRQLPESSYMQFTVKKLAHGKVVWLNFDLLREMGVEIPANGLTPEFEREILDAFGWAIPNDRDPANAFTGEQRTMYADRYGGVGIGVNWGSGRAGSMGEVQIKGVGITPLVGTGQTFDHAHGGASLEEAMREAVWGEVNDQELPYGANRVIAIIDSGTATNWTDGGHEARALIVREDPLRPAHFVAARWGHGPWRETEDARLQAAVRQLPQDLPADASATDISAKIASGMDNYVDHMADQYAAAYARSLYHGATSVSNFEISGRYIDYGTQTSQAGFAPIKVLDHVGAFGDIEEIKNVLIGEFHAGVSSGGLGNLPSAEQLKERFTNRYLDSLSKEFLILAGCPPELASELFHKPSAVKFAARIQMDLIEVRDPVNVDRAMPPNLDKYDVREILARIASDRHPSKSSLDSALQQLIPEQRTRSPFVEGYLDFYVDLLSEAQSNGISADALATYIHEASRIRNRKQTELYRSDMRERNVHLIDEYKRTGDRGPIWREINSHIAAGERSYRDLEPFQLVIKESPNVVEGSTLRHVFDARKNQELMVYRIEIQDGKGRFYGHEISEADLKRASIRFSSDAWASHGEAQATARQGSVEFQIPVRSQNGAIASHIELAMHSPDGRVWWKKRESNIHLNLSAEDRGNACVVNLLGSWWE